MPAKVLALPRSVDHWMQHLDDFITEAPQVLAQYDGGTFSWQQAECITKHDALSDKALCKVFPIDDGAYLLQLLYITDTTTPLTSLLTCIEFKPEYFHQFAAHALMDAAPFKHDFSHTHEFGICAKSSQWLLQLNRLNSSQLTDGLKAIELTAALLRRAVELIAVPFQSCTVPACRFLAADSEREKIFKARKILNQEVGNPISIAELSKKVAMNECYLKKGFKTLVGKTIHEYQQELRIAEAKRLLAEEGLSVSEISVMLGYSSISHFSTAFRKATGLKPCELLR